MATGPICGKDGRFRVRILGVDQPVAGISDWSRRARASIQKAVDFEAPTNSQGLPIGRPCPGPVDIVYEVTGYFFTDPAVGIAYSSDLFDVGSTVQADYILRKLGVIGIKGVICVVESINIGQRVENMAPFSATLVQASADPVPLVA